MAESKTLNKRILVLDDSKLILEWTKDVLEAAGYDVETTDSVFSAKQLAQNAPDLLLMDVHFTEEFKEGVAATKSLKRDQQTEHIPIILYSGLEQDILIALAQDCGADGFICKTDSPDVLVQQVTFCLSEAELYKMESQLASADIH